MAKPEPVPAPAPVKPVEPPEVPEVKPVPKPEPVKPAEPPKAVVAKPEPVPAPAPVKPVEPPKVPEVKPAPKPEPVKPAEPPKAVVAKPEPVPAPTPVKPVEPPKVPEVKPEPVKQLETKPAVVTPTPTPATLVTAPPKESGPRPAAKVDQFRYRFDPEGRDSPVLTPEGKDILPHQVREFYGKAFGVYDEGLNVCSAEYAAKMRVPETKIPTYTDLSGWDSVHVQAGVLAIDPRLGRFQFSKGKKGKLREVGRCYIGWGEPRDVVISGHYAFLAIAESSHPVSIYDISDPSTPVKVGMIKNEDMEWPTRLGVSGGRLFIPSRFRTMGVVDVSDVKAPQRLASLHILKSRDRTAAGARSVVLDGEHAFITVHSKGVAVWHVPFRRPHWARQVSMIEIPEPFNAMAKPRVVNDHLFLANTDRLLIYNVADRRAPKPVSSLRVGCNSVQVQDKTAYLAGADGTFSVVDISNIEQPMVVGKCRPFNVPEEGLDDIAIEGKFAYVTVRCQPKKRLCFLSIDVSDPTKPNVAGRGIVRPAFADAHAYGDPSVRDPYKNPVPVILDDNIECLPTSIAVSQHHAYVSDIHFGLWVFDVSDPASPKLVGGANDSGEVSSAYVEGNYVYVPQNMKGGLSIINVSSPQNPRWMSYYHTSTDSWAAVSRDNRFCYFTGYSPNVGTHLRTLDVSEPARPKLLSALDAGQDRGVSLAGDSLFMHGKVFDIRRPGRPRVCGTLPDVGEGWGLRQIAVGNRLYVCRNTELAVIDISSPAQPTKIGSVKLPQPNWWCERIQVAGDMVLVPHGEQGIILVDVSVETAPRVAAHYPIKVLRGGAKWLLGKALGVDRLTKGVIISAEMVGSIIYAADYWDSIYAVDVSDINNPKVVDRIPSYYGYALDISGDYIYRATLDGLSILDLPRPSEAPRGNVKAIALQR